MARVHLGLPVDEIRVQVLPHAVVAARDRFVECQHIDDSRVKEYVTNRIVEGIARGDVYDTKPKHFRVTGEFGRIVSWHRIVTTPKHGFLLDIAELPIVKVVTVLVPIQKWHVT